jgi:hypothetical protein
MNPKALEYYKRAIARQKVRKELQVAIILTDDNGQPLPFKEDD